MLALAVVFLVGLSVAVKAGEPRGRAVTEPETYREGANLGQRASVAQASVEAGSSGSVTVTVRGLYRGHTSAYWARRYRERTRQFQHARRRVQHLKQQLRERHTSRAAPSSAAAGLNYWIGRQIYAANQIGGHGGDPWPNCPDPFDGGGSWQDTVNCENGGNWLDSPGYYRCGLQFDPMWERKYGRLCP